MCHVSLDSSSVPLHPLENNVASDNNLLLRDFLKPTSMSSHDSAGSRPQLSMSGLPMSELQSSSALVRQRAVRALADVVSQLPPNLTACTGLLSLLARIASQDWSPCVRESALQVAATLPEQPGKASLFQSALTDSDLQVRAAAYGCLAIADAFDIVCGHLVLESDPIVRRSAYSCLESIARSGQLPCEKQLLVALGKVDREASMEELLADGEYVCALADGLTDSDAAVRIAAVRAIAAFAGAVTSGQQRPKPQSSVIRIALELASDVIIRDRQPSVRREAMTALATVAVGRKPALDCDCVRSLLRELGGDNCLPALDVLSSRPLKDLRAFVTAVVAIETELRRMQMEFVGDVHAESVLRRLDSALTDIVNNNYALACVGDLSRESSAKLVPHRAAKLSHRTCT